MTDLKNIPPLSNGISFQGIDGKPMEVTGIGSLDDELRRKPRADNFPDVFYPDVHLADYRDGIKIPGCQEIFSKLNIALKKRRTALARLNKRGLKVSSKYIN